MAEQRSRDATLVRAQQERDHLGVKLPVQGEALMTGEKLTVGHSLRAFSAPRSLRGRRMIAMRDNEWAEAGLGVRCHGREYLRLRRGSPPGKFMPPPSIRRHEALQEEDS